MTHVLTTHKSLHIDGIYDSAAEALAERQDHQRPLSAERFNRKWRKQWLDREPWRMTQDEVNQRPVIKALYYETHGILLLGAPEAAPLALCVMQRDGEYTAKYCDPQDKSTWMGQGRGR